MADLKNAARFLGKCRISGRQVINPVVMAFFILLDRGADGFDNARVRQGRLAAEA